MGWHWKLYQMSMRNFWGIRYTLLYPWFQKHCYLQCITCTITINVLSAGTFAYYYRLKSWSNMLKSFRFYLNVYVFDKITVIWKPNSNFWHSNVIRNAKCYFYTMLSTVSYVIGGIESE